MFRILKGPPAKTHASTPAAADFVDLSEEIQARLEAAQTEAARVIAEAREAADRIRREAQQAGQRQARDAAQQQGRAETERRLATALPALERALESLQRDKNQHLQQCERQVVRLALAIAERVIRRELSSRPEITLDLIREALQLAASNDRVTLHLNPEDYDTWREPLARLMAQRSETQKLECLPDPDVTLGGCVVKTEFGSIDQQFQAQLARIAEELS